MEQINMEIESGLPIKEIESPSAFNKGINDYFNHFIIVVDAKAGAILAADLILLSGLISIEFKYCLIIPYLLCGICLIASFIFCCIVFYPRLNKSEKGFIFWENVKDFNSAEEYKSELQKLSVKNQEEQYAIQNWFVSKVLSRKNNLIRKAIILLCIGLSLLALNFLYIKI